MEHRSQAVVLLSGGLDSTTTLAIAIDEGFEPSALTIHYGQRHRHEVEAARRIARRMKVRRHVVLKIDLGRFGGSALVSDIPVPRRASVDEIGDEIPPTYVPARNTIFLSLALAWAETLGTGDIFIGVNARDYSGYPDCRPEYIAAFQSMANLATKAGVERTCPVAIHTPLIDMAKSQIIQRGIALGVDYSWTTSCYDPDGDGKACGSCDACLLRLGGFREAGILDPAAYQIGCR